MIRPSILWRLYAGYVVVILISTTIAGILVGRQVTDNALNELQVSLTVRSEMLAELSRDTLMLAAPKQKLSELQNIIGMLGEKSKSRLTVIRANGVVIADSRESPVNMDNHKDRPEIIGARESGKSTTIRFSQTVSQNMSYIARRVDSSQGVLGFVRVSIPLQYIEERKTQLRWLILIGAMFSSAAALVLGFYFAKRFTDPLRDMTEIASEISRGNYERRVSVNHKDELSVLATALNRMARSSADRVMEVTTERNRLAKVLTSMAEGVIAIDSDRRIIHINHAALKLLENDLELTNSTLPDPSKYNLVWEDIRVPEIIDSVARAFKSGLLITSLVKRANINQDHVVDIKVSPIIDQYNVVSGAVVVLNDVSELFRLERVRRDFVSNASHELKTPITAIRGLTETILDDPSMDEGTQQRYLKKITTQSMRLSMLVADLLSISRFEAVESQKLLDLVDMQELVKRSVATAMPASEAKNLEISYRFDNGVSEIKPIARGDVQSLNQVVDNLLDNAITYTPDNGRISISLSVIEEEIHIKVIDTGIGIEKIAQQRIFERFYRVDSARSKNIGGTGLGLSIVKNIVEQHGGTVTVESTPSLGSTFKMILPLSK